jgi:hypothetical protein
VDDCSVRRASHYPTPSNELLDPFNLPAAVSLLAVQISATEQPCLFLSGYLVLLKTGR